jgi:sulfate adenylyltransferase subunit 1
MPQQGGTKYASNRGVLRFFTAGSVDDGKSTLIGRLLHDTRQILEDQLAAVAQASRKRGFDGADLSLLTDGLEAEREQGITIDVAYRYFATPRRKFIIADTPGHEQYTRNMATGASSADCAVVLADAAKGLVSQGRRHLYIAQLLGIRHIVVAVNKMDRVAYSQAAFDAVRGQFERFAAPLAIPDLRFIPLSALAGDMVVERGVNLPWYAGPTLLELLESLDPVHEALVRPLRFAVQGVRRSGNARHYIGRIASGALRAGDEILALPAGRRVRVAEIGAFDGPRESAAAGDSIALALDTEIDLARGDLLADPAQPPRVARSLDATLVWLAAEPLAAHGRYLLKHTTRTVRARVGEVHHHLDVETHAARDANGTLALNDIARATLSVQQPLFCDAYADNRATGAFILIDEATQQTVAAGMVGE